MWFVSLTTLTGLGDSKPSMLDNAIGREDFALKSGDNFIPIDFPSIERGKIKATLSYIFFSPPSEAVERMQNMIIKKIEMSDEKGRTKIIDEEIPARMLALNILETTFQPYVIAAVEEEIKL